MSRIVIVTPVYLPYSAGMAHVASEEASRLVERGHEVHVVTRLERGSLAEEMIDNVMVHRWRSLISFGKAGWIPFLCSRVSKLNPDIVHLHLPFFGCQELTVWSRKIRLVVTYHMDITVGGFVGFVSSVSRKLFLPRLFKRAEKILVASMDYARTSWLNDSWRVIKEKVIEAPFGVDLDRFHPLDRGFEHATPTFKLLFVGALDRAHPFKGVGIMLKALASLESQSDWHLTIVGGGDALESIEQEVRGLDLELRVSFTGRVSDEDLPSYYREADLFIFPSTSRAEAFGLVALEAQASGIPVIASNLDGVSTVIDDGVTGWLIPSGDIRALKEKIKWAVENRESVMVAGLAAREMVEKRFSWDKHIDDLERVYNREVRS
jgi:glycosyltransferase involved in cell wall biosynthesis